MKTIIHALLVMLFLNTTIGSNNELHSKAKQEVAKQFPFAQVIACYQTLNQEKKLETINQFLCQMTSPSERFQAIVTFKLNKKSGKIKETTIFRY
ncbi:hypothetical protein LC087_07320 [Bacillus carboniphilus]|uniref:Uncharacterized protein n=1 Tax=Bacillus carboniphilus TaxID=86663 RepID=A0ABY9JX26_9BACI|nr:hypothetical protein [Bacillus carboniphilus]WLR43915.1 hypothetical protein LC087_07320 [Bacillus carboniphilus]